MYHWHIEHISDFGSAIINHEVDEVRRLLRIPIFPINGSTSYGDRPIIECIESCHGKEDEPKTLEILKLLVQHGADVNVRSHLCPYRGMTAAMIAAAKGLESCLRFLVESGTDLTLRAEYEVDDFEAEGEYCENNNGQTALMLAASGSDDAHALCVKYLVEAGADLNVLDKFGGTALMLAAKAGGFNSVKYLTERMSVSSLNQRNYEGETALMIAGSHNSSEQTSCLKCLVEAGADLNGMDEFGNTALMLAAKAGVINSVKYLMERMSVPSLIQTNNIGQTTLMLAASGSDDANALCVKYLVEAGADLNVQDEFGNTALMLAARAEWLNSVKYRTERMSVSSLIQTNNEGQTALMIAASNNSSEQTSCLKFLVEAGADLNVQNKRGYTALMHASKRGSVESVKLLTERMSVPTLNQANDKGQTALMLAASRYVDILKYLVEAGADMNVQCKRGYTALMHASKSGNEESVKLLTERVSVSTLNQANDYGQTALMLATSRCDDNDAVILKHLLEAGADLNVQDKDGYTALMYASELGSVESVKFLTERMSVSTLDKVNDEGQTALMLAASRYDTDNAEILKYIVEAGADVNIQCKRGYNAFVLAASRYDIENSHLQCLITARADLNVADTETGYTALMFAIARWDDSAVSLLLEKGAHVNIVTPDLKTPLSFLNSGRNNVMITKLLSHGLDPALSYRDQEILHVMVAEGEKSLVRGLFMNGFPPVDVQFTGSPRGSNQVLLPPPDMPVSPLALALVSERHDIARYLIVNRFFTRYDLVQLCRDQKFRKCLQREPACLEILDFLSARPYSLRDLCLVTISSALSQYLVHDLRHIPPGDSRWMCKPTFRERVDLLQLPPTLKRELLHDTPSSSISCESWGNIALE